LKEGRAANALRLLCRFAPLGDCDQQCARQSLDRQCVSAGRDHQLAELLELTGLEQSGLVVECLQFSVEVTGFAHGDVLG
jgi:hypothetical protein